MGEILFAVQMIRTGRIPHAADAHFRGHGLQLAIAIHLAGQAVQGVIGQDQFDDVPAQPLHLGRFRENVHPVGDRGVAGGHHPAGTIRFQSHFHRADPARAIGFQLGRITERRDVPAAAVTVDEVQNHFAGLEPHGFAVKVSGESGDILDHGWGTG